MSEIRNCQITGWGTYLPENIVKFGDQIRYRVEDHETQLGMLTTASRLAIEKAGLGPEDIDCLISASAVGVQPIPCTAALLHEAVAPDTNAFSFDVNSTCTSFLTALDTASYFVNAGTYDNVLIASGDVGSRGLNPNQKESYELFSDAAAAVVLSRTDKKSQGILASKHGNWPRNAHDTEIRGGLTGLPPDYFADKPEEFMFDMEGKKILRSVMEVVPPMFQDFHTESGLTIEDFKLVIPHQASKALRWMMMLLQVPEDKYVDIVQSHGNMVSASVPFALCEMLGTGALQTGDKALLCGTAAGLTVNIVAMEL